MSFSLFINFDGNCREAAEFYAKAFNSKVEQMMLYKDAPPNPDYPMAEADKDRVMYCQVPIFGCNVMFCDVPSNMSLTIGDNISPTLGGKDGAELTRVFHALSEGGKVEMPLEKTFWSELYGMVVDKFGVIWQVSQEGEMPQM